eukprot:TRINITY_DN23949_c0_g1_i1.p1 TRINITY_DN23949_c0_g1~~TRINITY_DN23949_c0_g1_i1.p1  ORF type:complete len:376 (-),score=85.13 TRINITY_DN23949_c0_g1_i1:17-1114(-)
MEDSTEESIIKVSSGNGELLRGSAQSGGSSSSSFERQDTRPRGGGGGGGGGGGKGGQRGSRKGGSRHPSCSNSSAEPCWQSDEKQCGHAWVEIGAPAGRALAQIQVGLQCMGSHRVDSFTPEHVQLFIAEEGEPLAELPIFETRQFWSLAFPGEPISLPQQELLPPRTCRARLCIKQAACGGRNVRMQSVRILTRRLKRRREDEGRLACRLWSDEEFSDCTVRSEEGTALKVHRAVLAMASPVFNRMLNFHSPMREGSRGEINLPCSANVVRALMRHCYGLPRENSLSLEDELALVEQAHAFELGALCEEAASAAIDRLSEDTAVPLIRGLRTFYKAGALKEEWESLVRRVRARQDLCNAVFLAG